MYQITKIRLYIQKNKFQTLVYNNSKVERKFSVATTCFFV